MPLPQLVPPTRDVRLSPAHEQRSLHGPAWPSDWQPSFSDPPGYSYP